MLESVDVEAGAAAATASFSAVASHQRAKPRSASRRASSSSSSDGPKWVMRCLRSGGSVAQTLPQSEQTYRGLVRGLVTRTPTMPSSQNGITPSGWRGARLHPSRSSERTKLSLPEPSAVCHKQPAPRALVRRRSRSSAATALAGSPAERSAPVDLRTMSDACSTCSCGASLRIAPTKTPSAPRSLATTSTFLPSAAWLHTTLARVCVLPQPGGPRSTYESPTSARDIARRWLESAEPSWSGNAPPVGDFGAGAAEAPTLFGTRGRVLRTRVAKAGDARRKAAAWLKVSSAILRQLSTNEVSPECPVAAPASTPQSSSRQPRLVPRPERDCANAVLRSGALPSSPRAEAAVG
eukprot:scaffold1182_cov124-Isochrysis_galbana.AAC.10